jgi:hypothetical protein
MLLAQHTANGRVAVGLCQEALPLRFLIATTAQQGFPTPISENQCPSVFKYPIRKISVYSRLII